MEDSEAAAFRQFVTVNYPALLRLARMLERDPGHVEDLVQEALLRVGQHWPTAHEAPLAYTRRTLINLVNDRHRFFARRPREQPWDDIADLDLVPTTADPAEAIASRVATLEALKMLPERQRAVIVLRFWHDLSTEQIADVLGCAPGTVKTHSGRALTTLRGRIDVIAALAADPTALPGPRPAAPAEKEGAPR